MEYPLQSKAEPKEPAPASPSQPQAAPEALKAATAPDNENAVSNAQTPVKTPPHTHHAATGPKQRTTGNKIFDFGVYSTIAWGGVSVMSLAVAHQATAGKIPAFQWLRDATNTFSKGVANFLGKTIMKGKPQEDIDLWAKSTTLYWALGTGGTTLMWPIKYMEDNRQKLAAKIDTALGTTPPHPDTIAAEPKQSWYSVLCGRALSTGTGFLAFCAMGPKNADKISRFFGKHATDAIMTIKPGANPATVRKWADIAVFDVFFTTITASIMYMFSRYVAKKNDQQIGDIIETTTSPATGLDACQTAHDVVLGPGQSYCTPPPAQAQAAPEQQETSFADREKRNAPRKPEPRSVTADALDKKLDASFADRANREQASQPLAERY